jgi:VIT1/CCC1 family predicted Fe2+/Mn2+ transporter
MQFRAVALAGRSPYTQFNPAGSSLLARFDSSRAGAKRKDALKMKLTPPKHPTFIAAIVLGVIAVILQIVPDFGLHQYTFALAVVGFALLALGNLIENL